MRAPNHVVGGGVLTGAAASLFFGINIFSNPILVIVTIVGSLLPDIDHTSSILGKLFYPISRQINRRYGHRTITHSIPFLAVLTGFSMMIETLYSSNWNVSIVLCIAVFVHSLLDMMTVSGVKIMYPFQKDKIYVMIGRKDFRMRVDDIRAEAIAMFIFLGMWLLLLPLIQNGFWTTYNTYFGKPQHLVGEFQNSTDLLAVDYQIKRGSQVIQGKGFCVEASTSKIVLLEDGVWNILDAKNEIIEKVVPIHTGKNFRFKAINLIEISVDSLNHMVKEHPIAGLQIAANQKFKFKEGLIEQSVTKYQGEYIQQITFSTIEQDIVTELFSYDNSHLPRIKSLQTKIAQLKAQDKRNHSAYIDTQRKLSALRATYTSASITEKESIAQQIKELGKVKRVGDSNTKIQEYENQITQIQSEASIKNQQQKQVIEQRNQAAQSQVQETKFTGILRTVIIEEN